MMKKLLLTLFALLIAGQIIEVNAQSRSLPFDWDNATVYFMLNDRFNNGDTGNDNSYGRRRNSPNGELDFQGGDLKGITKKINEGYFDNLGVNAIWITAPYEQMHGSIGSENAWAYHGYWTKDWSQVDKNMGTEDDLRAMVDAAHDHGIRVVMDIVLNHTGYPTFADDPWPDSWVRVNDCNHDPIYCCLAGLPDIKTEMKSGQVNLPQWLLNKWNAVGVKDKELRELDEFFRRTGYPRTPRYYIIKWLTDWIREFGIDGFRIDTAKHVEVDVWKELKEEAIKALREWKNNNAGKKPDDLDFWMTGEVFGQSIYSGKNYYFNNGFDNIINFGFINDLGSKSQEEIFSHYARTLNNDPGFNTLSYIASHDVGPYDRSNLYYAGTTLLLVPGGVQIFYGDESGRPYFHPQTYGDAGYRSFMNWNDIENNQQTKNLLNHWSKLGRFRREHLSVGGGSHERLSTNPYIFRRSYNKNGVEDKVLVALEIPENGNPYTMSVYGTFPDGVQLKDYFSGDIATVSNGKVTFNTSFGTILAGIPFEGGTGVNLSVSPESGHYENGTSVSMSANTTAGGASTSIYYTRDGSAPNKNSTKYQGSFSVGSFDSPDITVKAIAYDSEGNKSGVVTRKYTFGPKEGYDLYFKNTSSWSQVYIYLFDKNQDKTIGKEWPGQLMEKVGTTPWYKYTVDYDGEVGIVFNDGNSQQTDDLFRQTEGWYVHSENKWYDECTGDCPEVEPYLTVSPSGGTYKDYVDVSLQATNNGEIYYTKNGDDPTQQKGTRYSGAVRLTANTTLKARAYNSAGESNLIEESYIIGDPGEGYDVYFKNTSNWSQVYIYLFDKNQNKTIGKEWPGQLMERVGTTPWYKYAIDYDGEAGIVFNNGNGQQTDDLFRQTKGWYVYSENKWYGSCPGDCPPEPEVPVLTVDPSGGRFYKKVDVTLEATNNGVIYYTTNGDYPTKEEKKYSGTISLTRTATLKAIAFNDDGESNLISEEYIIDGGTEGFDIHFKNTSDWSTVNIYIYDKNTNKTIGEGWPGQEMSREDDTPWYKYNIDAGVQVGIVFNNGNGQQTDDLFRTSEGWYVYSEQEWYNNCPGDCPVEIEVPVLNVDPTGGNFYKSVKVELTADNGEIYYTTNGNAPTKENGTKYGGAITITKTTTLKALAFNAAGESNLITEEYKIDGGTADFTVHFKNTSNWSDVYIYVYDKNSNSTIGQAWPGNAMTREGSSDWYKYTIDSGTEVGIVFNNGSGQQTDDLFRATDGWYDYSAKRWYDNCPGDCSGSQAEDGLTLYYNNNSTNWSTVTLYFWGLTPSGPTTSWPGVQMTDDDGDGWFKYTLEDVECGNLIFSNNGSSQTADLYKCDEGYYSNGWVDKPFDLKHAEGVNAVSSVSTELQLPYPNPFNEKVNLNVGGTDVTAIVKVSALNGSVVYDNTVTSTDGRLEVDLSFVPQGIYFMQVIANNTAYSYRLVKK